MCTFHVRNKLSSYNESLPVPVRWPRWAFGRPVVTAFGLSGSYAKASRVVISQGTVIRTVSRNFLVGLGLSPLGGLYSVLAATRQLSLFPTVTF